MTGFPCLSVFGNLMSIFGMVLEAQPSLAAVRFQSLAAVRINHLRQ